MTYMSTSNNAQVCQGGAVHPPHSLRLRGRMRNGFWSLTRGVFGVINGLDKSLILLSVVPGVG